jgi:iturin family lipopeptide synthetase A
MQKYFYPYKTLNSVLYSRSKETQKGIRFIKSSSEENFVTYADFYAQVLKYLGELQNRKGLKKEDEVIIYEEDNHKLLIGYWSCLLGGYIPIPISIGGKEEHVLKFFRIWNDLTNPHIFSSTTNLEKLTSFGLERNLIENESTFDNNFLNSSDIFNGETIGIPTERYSNDLAFIQYSSGSTGNPKGVMLTHENLVYNIYDTVEALGMIKEDNYLSWIPLTHDLGMIAVHLSTILTGCNQLIMPTNLFIRRPLLWMQKTHEHKATRLCSPNFGYQYFLQSYTRNNNNFDWDLSSVKTIINGAEPISSKICSDFTTLLSKHKLLINCIKPCYGLAEASVALTLVRGENSIKKDYVNRNSLFIGNALEFEDEYIEGKTLEFVNVGNVITNSKIVINNEKGDRLEPNTLGFIDIKGKNVTKGYYKNPDATKAVFVKGDWLRTGDLGFLKHDGSLVITGRHKNMIILQGLNYYAHDVEDIIIGIADITLGKVAVCGISGNGEQKEKLFVFVYYKKKIITFLDTIISIQERLSNALGIIPEMIIPVKEIPKTTSGKVQHSFLLKKYEQGDFNDIINNINKSIVEHTIENWISSTNPMKEISIWLEKQSKQLLHLKDFNLNINVPLADQGFKSIHALQLSQIIKTRLGIKTTPTILYKYPTVYKLSEYIHKQLFNLEKEEILENSFIKDDNVLLNEIESLNEEEVLKMLEL